MSTILTSPRTEKTVMKLITAREAHLLMLLRKYAFGRIVIHKANGQLIRIEPTFTELISDSEGLDLAKD